MATMSRTEQQTAESFRRRWRLSAWRAQHAATVVHDTSKDVKARRSWRGNDTPSLDELVATDEAEAGPKAASEPASRAMTGA